MINKSSVPDDIYLPIKDKQSFFDNIQKYPYYIICIKCKKVIMFDKADNISYVTKICPDCRIKDIRSKNYLIIE